MIDALNRLLNPIKRKISMMVARGRVELVTDAKKIQQMQATFLADETLDRLERIQEFGFTSTPKPGAQVVALFLNGSRDHGVIIACDDGTVRPQDVAEGEAAVYSYGKYQVRVKNDRIQVGKDGTYETVVVGETLAELLGKLIDDLATHTHGAPGAPPTQATTISARKDSYITNNKILAEDGGRF